MDISVCLLNDSFPPLIDGVSTTVYNYASIINSKYGLCAVATPAYPGVHDDYPFPVIRYPSIKTEKFFGYRSGLPVTPVVAKELKKLGVNILHSHCPFASSVLARTLRTSVLARTLRPALDAPIVFTYHTKFDVDIANTFKSEILQTAVINVMMANIRTSDEVWVVSPGAAENLRGLGYTGQPLLMENGVDFSKGPSERSDVEALAARYGIRKDMSVFLFVGRMMWYKGIRTILDGLYMAKARGVKFKMIFVGGGQDYDAIVKNAELLGLADACVFTGRVSDRGELRAHYSLADMFLFPSDYDTSGIVVREAAACGLASVLLRDSSAAHGVTDGRNGLLIHDDASDLMDAVIRTASDREWAGALGRRAMDDLYLSWDDAVARAWRRYGEVLEGYREAGKNRKP
ncbi:MAG: glycosyltransferase [Oscillospiraceae bacterium]|jgi:glycosyltransferase involved in cell wall biosynthesis|nr:glycosyltransferase [Oscillospiraceae bacterium]